MQTARFAIQLSPGPSREVIASFAGNRALGRSAAQSARLRVGSEVELHVSAPVAKVGGRPVMFSGKVPASGGSTRRTESRCSCSSGYLGCPGPSFGRFKPIDRETSPTRTDFAMTTAAAMAFSSGPMRRRKATGLTSREARGQSPSRGLMNAAAD